MIRRFRLACVIVCASSVMAGGLCAQALPAKARAAAKPAAAPPPASGLGVVSAKARARVILECDTVSGAGLVAVRLRVEGRGFTVASYQGVVHFDPAAGTVVTTVAATTGEGQNLLNAEPAKAGALNFAGFSARGFAASTVDVGRIVFRAASIERLRVTAALDVVGDPDGKSVPASQRLPASLASGRAGGR